MLIDPNIPRNWSKVGPKGKGPVPQQEEFQPDQTTLADVYRIFEERLDKQLNRIKSHYDEFTEKVIERRQHSARLEQGARQSRLAIEADVTSDKKTRKRTEGAAAAERMLSGDNSSAQVDTNPIRLTSLGENSTGLPALFCPRDDALVDNGTATPKPCLSPAEMRTRTAAGSLLPAGTVSTAMRRVLSRMTSRPLEY